MPALNLPPLREDLGLLEAAGGLLLQDPRRWLLFLAPAGLAREPLARWLQRSGLAPASQLPPMRSRRRQYFCVSPDWLPASGLQAQAGARFSCIACSRSCTDPRLGPLPRSDVALLLGLDWAGKGPRPDDLFTDRWDEPFSAAQAREGIHDVFLRRGATGCTLLDPNGLCSVHATFGVEKKPLMCRTFPFEFVATPRGVRVALRLDGCRSRSSPASWPGCWPGTTRSGWCRRASGWRLTGWWPGRSWRS